MVSFSSCNKLPKATLSLLASGIGPYIPLDIIETVQRDQVSHLNLHANNIERLSVQLEHDHPSGEVPCLEYLENLDVSSNKLARIISSPKCMHSVLDISKNLIQLNLAANQLTSASLANLFQRGTIRLPALKVLNLSHNLLTRIPILKDEKIVGSTVQGDDSRSIICTSCPNLETLVLINNRISDFHELVKALQSFQLVLKQLSLQKEEETQGRGQKEREHNSNPVCNHPSYRQHIILALKGLIELDGTPISLEERNDAQMKNNTTNIAIHGCLSLSKQNSTTFPVGDNSITFKRKHIQKTHCKVDDTKQQTQRVISSCGAHKVAVCPEKSQASARSWNHNTTLTNMIRNQRSSSLKLKDLEKQIDTLTDLTQKHTDVTSHLISSTCQDKKPLESAHDELSEVSKVDHDVQTSFLSIDNLDEKFQSENERRGDCITKDIYLKDSFYLVFALFFFCHYWFMFVRDGRYRATQRRLKICLQKLNTINQSQLSHQPTSTTPENISNQSASFVQAMQDEILLLSQKLVGCEEQVQSYTIKYQRLKMQNKELKRRLFHAQESEQDARSQVYACHNCMNQFEQIESMLRSEVEKHMRELKEEQVKNNTLRGELSEKKIQHMIDIENLETIITRYEIEGQRLKSEFELLSQKSAEQKETKNIFEPIINQVKEQLQDKMLELDNLKLDFSKQKNEYDTVKAELSACRMDLRESQKIVDKAQKKEEETKEGMLTLIMRLEQVDTLLFQRSTDLDTAKEKYKRKTEKLLESEQKIHNLVQQLDNMMIQQQEQAQSYAKLLENQHGEKHKEQILKMEIDHLKTKLKEMEENDMRQKDLLENYERDALEKHDLFQGLVSDMDILQRQKDKLASRRERAEQQVRSLTDELERERRAKYALHEQQKEATKVHELQYGKAKAFIENAYNEIIKSSKSNS